MSFDPIAAQFAVQAARATAGSARPDAPVIPDSPARTPWAGAARRRTAARLRGLAGWIEPAPTCQARAH